MNEEYKQQQAELISKYLAGEASPEEAMQLHESLNDQSNKDEYNKLVQLWNNVTATHSAHFPSAEQEWVELQKQIQPEQKSKLRKLLYTRIAVAATIIGIVVLGSYPLFFKNENKQIALKNEQKNILKTATIVKVATQVARPETLPDGSVVTMNKTSSIAYAPNFNNKTREITLTGEAFFNVTHDKIKPFVVTIDELKIQVIGTSFNVRKIAADGNIEVQVQTGIVKMFTKQKEITVVKGQTGIYNKNGQLNLKDTIDINSISYVTKSFFFKDLSFVDACRYLEKTFSVTIKIDAAKFSDCRITAEFKSKSLEYILDVITATLNSSYKKQDNTVYIIGDGCK